MEKIKMIILLSLFIMVFSSCNGDFDKRQIVISEKNNDIIMDKGSSETFNEVSSNEFKKYEGVYEYEYEYNTEDLIENHYIVLEYVNGTLQGTYYGTSDDFDDEREGYYPGFFVSRMRNLQINDDTIIFNLKLQDSDIFIKPIDLVYKSSKDVTTDDNPNWSIGLRKYNRNYIGKIINNEIKLEVDLGPRVFKKRSLN